jgi:N-acetyl-alpha-D-muramate 1-phosphate uridylyltransferase
MTEVCAVILAAGFGTRLSPLTSLTPKALVPVGNVPLLDRSLHRLATAGFSSPDRVAVNVHHHADLVAHHVGGRAHLSFEEGEPLGSAGALGHLRGWIDGRSVLVVNADAYAAVPDEDLLALLDGWDGRKVRILGHKADDGHPPFDGLAFAGVSLIPADDAAALKDEYSHLVLTTWRPAQRAGRLEVLPLNGVYIDCGTPADYLAANLHAAGGENLVDATAVVTGPAEASVVGARARCMGAIRRCVLWPDAEVGAGEVLRDAIRVGGDLTVDATRA